MAKKISSQLRFLKNKSYEEKGIYELWAPWIEENQMFGL